MKPETLAALQESIAHWERLYACEDYGCMAAEGWHSNSCKLCDLFLDEKPMCYGCPVAKKADTICCYGTPWHDADAAIGMLSIRTTTKQEAKLAIKAELNFLKSLLPEAAQE